MKYYDFDEIIDRENTCSMKYGQRKNVFGANNIIPLWIADMDFRTPDFIVEAIKGRAAHEIYGYTFVPESFFESVQYWMEKQHDWKIDREWILYSPGVVPSLVIAVLTFTQPGDAVVVHPPVYYPFFSVIQDNGCTLVENPLSLQNGRLCMDFEHLQKCLDRRTKLLFLCSPRNPGGTVWKRDELAELGEICRKNGTIIVSDEIHSDLIFQGKRHIPIASLSERDAANTITLVSPNKTFNLSGVNGSVAIIPAPNLRRKFKQTLLRLHWGLPNIFSLTALEEAYRKGSDWLRQLLTYLENNLSWVLNYFASNLTEIRAIRPEGTYLVWLDFRGLRMNRDELNKFLVEKAKIGLSDGCLFGPGGAGFQRMNIACPLPILKAALARLDLALKSHHRVF